jgi:cytochrome c oxidase subunit II
MLVLAALAALPLGILGWRQASKPSPLEQVYEIRAVMPEEGGWLPDQLSVEAGQPLHLRLVSDDVVHGFAVGKMDWPAIDMYPGEVIETTLVFDKPGKYTYYCTRWCGVNHWRMRGVIEVTGPVEFGPRPPAPLYETLGIDIDAPHPASVTPDRKPSASRGAALSVVVPSSYQNPAYIVGSSPAEIWLDLRAESSLTNISDHELWDLVASLWQAQIPPEAITRGAELYAQNCASCHGEGGAGDGVMAKYFGAQLAEDLEHIRLTGQNSGNPGELSGEHGLLPPADLSDPSQMLGASPALLQGKIIRGGMGTGMPYWGPIFTEEESWALVAYIWSLQFEFENK